MYVDTSVVLSRTCCDIRDKNSCRQNIVWILSERGWNFALYIMYVCTYILVMMVERCVASFEF